MGLRVVKSLLYFDTNILIYLFELHDPYSKKVATILEEFTDSGKQLPTSAITVTEFLVGTTSSSLETLHKVQRLNIIPVDENLAGQAQLLYKEKRHLSLHKCPELYFIGAN